MPFPENSTVVVAHGAWADDVIVEAARESLFLVPLQISRGEIVWVSNSLSSLLEREVIPCPCGEMDDRGFYAYGR